MRSRLEAIFIWSWNTTIACLVAGRGFPNLLPSIMSIISIVLLSIAVYVYNDIIDSELDKFHITKKERPIPSGRVSVRDALIIIYISSFIGLLVSFFINIICFIFSLSFLILFIIYSYPKIRLKKRVFIKEFSIFVGFIITGIIGSFAAASVFSPTAAFSSMLFGIFIFVGQPALQDTFDIEADTLFDVKTLATVLNWKRRMQLFVTGVLVIMTLTPFTYIQLKFNILLPIYVVAGGLILLRFMFPIMNNFEIIAVLKVKKSSYVYFILLQVFAVLGSLNLQFPF